MADVDITAWRGASELFVPLADGVCATTAVGEALRRLVRERVSQPFRAEVDLALELPPVVPASVATTSGYVASFPHLLGAVRSFSGTRRDHLPLLEAVERGDDWGASLAATDVVLVPAACHGLYAVHAGATVSSMTAEVSARCFRHEPAVDPTRLQSFHMLEFVALGTAAHAQGFADVGVDRAAGALRALGLRPEPEVAHDPFFGVGAAMLVAEQEAKNVKTELVVGGPNGPYAVASVNRHGAHFGESFAIGAGDGVAHSACVAFGIERVMLAIAVAASADDASASLIDEARRFARSAS